MIQDYVDVLKWCGMIICVVCKNGCFVIGGDGQVLIGFMVMKGNV